MIETNETKTCDSCGKEFFCVGKNRKCWCFAVDLNSEILAKLNEDFGNCLCEKCLRMFKVEENKL